jgi:hypothetical protein
MTVVIKTFTAICASFYLRPTYQPRIILKLKLTCGFLGRIIRVILMPNITLNFWSCMNIMIFRILNIQYRSVYRVFLTSQSIDLGHLNARSKWAGIKWRYKLEVPGYKNRGPAHNFDYPSTRIYIQHLSKNTFVEIDNKIEILCSGYYHQGGIM